MIMQFDTGSGHIFMLDNLIAFIVFSGYIIWITIHNTPGKRDKIKHTLISSALTGIFLIPLALLKVWWIAPILAIAIGVGKEIMDKLNPKKKLFDWMDIVADAIGIVAVVIPYILYVIIK